MEATKKGKLAEKKVYDYLIKEGWTVIPRAKYKGVRKGFDFYATKNNEKRWIEVKGVKYEFSIPDLSETEWKDIDKGEMVATHLYIVGNIETENPCLYILNTKLIAQEVAKNRLKLVVKRIVKGRDLNKLKHLAEYHILS